MEPITTFNNLAVRLLLGGPSRFYEAEQVLRNAMTLLNQQSDEQQQPTVMSSSSSSNNNISTASSERLSNRRGRDSISRRSSSSSSSSSCTTSAVCSCLMADDLEDDDEIMSDDSDETFGDDDDACHLDTMAVKSLPLAYADTTASSSPLPAQVHLSLPLFNRALALSNTAEPEETAATVLYNLGLIHHMRGLLQLSDPLRPHESIHRALRLYDYAIRILQQRSHHQRVTQAQSNSTTALSDDDLMVDELLVLALFYNLGHVQSHLFAFDKAGIYFDFLRHVLDDSSSTSSMGGGTIALHDDDHSFFFLNAMLFQGEQLPLAPAA